ncbi:MAG: IS630 family transposase [Pleurocapsa minor HA4230-MV1]|jgi:transposase|nr:IS630 family transposase [Pleurocapsa minor HA4230-MV1]
MSGVPKIEIIESVEELKLLMKQQKTSLGYAKVQSLYLLKIKLVENINYLAVIIGRGESTIHRWLQLYKQGGLDSLLEEPPKTGRPKKLNIETVAKIQQELSEPEGFISYQEIQLWLLACQDLEISYSTIHRIVRYELQSKLKLPRPTHEKQAFGVVEAFKQFLPKRIEGIVRDIRDTWLERREIAYWCQDETRIGFRTESGKKITLKGVKPQQTLQWHYDYYYVYGLIEPISGRSFFYEFSHFNSDCMEIFLEKFQQENQEKIHIIQLDNAPIHTAKKLNVPDNVILLFQPPYSPEVNPIERVWQYIKYRLRSLWFINLDDVKEKVANILKSLDLEVVVSLANWKCFTDALSL